MVKRGRGSPLAKKKNINSGVVCDEIEPEFFKVFIPRLASHQLLIPPDYIKYFKKTIKERIVLKDAGGKKWYIDVEETPKGFYLKKGWPSFVEHHRLKLGEFLVFKYDKCYSFLVKIYGTNSCKKEITNDAPATRVKIEPKDIEQVLQDPSFMRNDKAGCSEEKCDEFLETEDALPRGPYFVPCDSQCKLEIPNEVIDRYSLDSKPEMVLRNSNGNEWPVRIFTVRGVGAGGHMYMGKAWSEFQKENEADFKDKYMFTFGTESSSTIIHVEVFKTPPNSD